MKNIQRQIQEQLLRIEEKEQVSILYACESGSRAWGFPSKDSDYDVRFIYVRPMEWYVSIFEKRDVIEQPIHDALDINGWDLRKALGLFRKSNPPLLEWLSSPIVYAEKGLAAEQLRGLVPKLFSPKSCMYHYVHMAQGNYREYLQGEFVKIKKYFYVLRPILACQWIEKYNRMPPMGFELLVDDLLSEEKELCSAIKTLLARKKAGEELKLERRIEVINGYVERGIAYYEQLSSQCRGADRNDDEQLDQLFRSILREAWEARG